VEAIEAPVGMPFTAGDASRSEEARKKSVVVEVTAVKECMFCV